VIEGITKFETIHYIVTEPAVSHHYRPCARRVSLLDFCILNVFSVAIVSNRSSAVLGKGSMPSRSRVQRWSTRLDLIMYPGVVTRRWYMGCGCSRRTIRSMFILHLSATSLIRADHTYHLDSPLRSAVPGTAPAVYPYPSHLCSPHASGCSTGIRRLSPVQRHYFVSAMPFTCHSIFIPPYED
jgi:hypothetical protein